MSEAVDVKEGPWVDAEGRQCLGIWANEGGQLLILRREKNEGVSFYAVGPEGADQRRTTMTSFRLKRIANFLLSGLPPK